MRMTKEQLLVAARTAAKYLPAASADIMKELANRLDVTSVALSEALEQRDNLIIENTALIHFIKTDCYVAHFEPETFSQEEVTRYVSADGYEPELSATYAEIASLRAEVLDEMAATYRGWANENDCSCNMKSSYNLTAERAESYAAYIRRPAKNEEATSNGR
ncbi:hypothetical protein SAMN03159434_11936 [Enterobacter sp. NFR05]|nr:hypothetical protein SAMN03159434_11936 [Enterobacter sp. NFR05]